MTSKGEGSHETNCVGRDDVERTEVRSLEVKECRTDNPHNLCVRTGVKL